MPRAAREGRGGDSGWAFTDRIRSRMLDTYSAEEVEKQVSEEAAKSVPTSMVEQVALVGPLEKVRGEVDAWKRSLLTTMIVAGPPELLRQAAELIL